MIDNKTNGLSAASLDALTYLLIDNNRSAIFECSLEGDVLNNPLRFIFQDFSYMGLDNVLSLQSLIDHIDPKSEICEVKGVTAYHREVSTEIAGNVRKTTTYIPLNIDGRCLPFELKIVRQEENGTMLGVIMELDEKSYNLEKLYADSYKDQMTGLFNKNVLDYHFSLNNAPHYIGFMDIDHFKSFNDRFSHSTGDQILKEVGKKLISIADPSVIFYRYGGDEFVFMTNNLDCEGTKRLIEKIQNAIASIEFFDVKISFSIGFAFSSPDIKEYAISDAVLLADYAMYISKKSQTEKVHFLSPEEAKALILQGSIKEALETMMREAKRSSSSSN